MFYDYFVHFRNDTIFLLGFHMNDPHSFIRPEEVIRR